MKAKNLLIAFAAVCPVALAFRIYQMLKMINPENGFIKEQYSTVDTIVKLVFLAVILLFMIFSRLCRDIDSFTLPQKSTPVAVGLFIMALGFVADTARFYCEIAGNTTIYGTADYILDAFYIITAASFIFMGGCVLTGRKIPALTGLIPLGCMLFRLILSYTRFNGLALLSENVLDILAMCFGMLFIHYYARIIGGSLPTKSARWLFGSGLVAALVSVLCTLPRWGLMFAGRNDLLASSHDAEFINIALAVFAIIILVSFVHSRKADDKTQNDTDNTAPSSHATFRPVDTAEENDPSKSAMLENIDRIYNEITDQESDSDKD